jgi:hypothetical protein
VQASVSELVGSLTIEQPQDVISAAADRHEAGGPTICAAWLEQAWHVNDHNVAMGCELAVGSQLARVDLEPQVVVG